MAIINRDPLLASELMYKHLFSRINAINSSYNKDLTDSKKIESKRLANKK